jgi:hypothetical protein
MNARLYDPALGRFLSPDPYVQAPGFSQSFNRYAYCLNNPLRYTDPSGEILGSIITFLRESVKAIEKTVYKAYSAAFLHGGLDIFSSTARKNAWDNYASDFRGAWRDFDPTRSGTKTNNALKIDAGLLMRIPFWEDPQALLGNIISHVRNLTGNVDNVDIYRWTVLVNDNGPGDAWGMTLGPYINSKNIKMGSDIYKHEYGHTIQSRILGSLYIGLIAIPSGLSELSIQMGFNSQSSHDNNWTEIWANQLAGVHESRKYIKYFKSNKFWYWGANILFPFYPN